MSIKFGSLFEFCECPKSQTWARSWTSTGSARRVRVCFWVRPLGFGYRARFDRSPGSRFRSLSPLGFIGFGRFGGFPSVGMRESPMPPLRSWFSFGKRNCQKKLPFEGALVWIGSDAVWANVRFACAGPRELGVLFGLVAHATATAVAGHWLLGSLQYGAGNPNNQTCTVVIFDSCFHKQPLAM